MIHIQVQNYKKSRVSYVSYIHTSYTKHTVLDLSNVRSNHAPLNYSGQESEKNLQFMILTYLWPWNKVKVNAKVDIYRIYSVRENRNVNVFGTYGRSAAGRPA